MATDLVTAGEVSTALPNLTVQQLLMVPALIGAASGLIADRFPRASGAADYEEVLDASQGRTLALGRRPLIGIERVSTDLAGVISITSTDPTLSRASVELESDGDDAAPTATGLILATKSAAGAASTTLAFTVYRTAQALADEVNTLTGWTATVPPGLGTVLGEDMPPIQGPYSARGAPAQIRAWTRDLHDWTVDRRKGELTIFELRPDSYRSPDREWGADPRGAAVRVAYRSGLTTIPQNIKQGCILVLKDMMDRIKIGAITYEWSPEYAYRLDVTKYQIPPAALALLSPYKDRSFS